MSDRLELHHVEHIIAACQDGPNEALVLAGTLAVVATVIKQRDTAEAALLTARREVETLRRALISHRSDLHNWSNRPCPTCRRSAEALGIDGKVPDSCALREKDAAALAAAQAPEKRESLCQLCNREYSIWFAPNALWNAVIRRGDDDADEWNFLCPTCFTNIAAERGIGAMFEVRLEAPRATLADGQEPR